MDISNTQEVKVFDLELNQKRKNTYTGKVSSFEGKDSDGDNKYSSWFANFVGDAFEKAANLKNTDTITLLRAKIENQYNKDSKMRYVTITIFDFEKVERKHTEE